MSERNRPDAVDHIGQAAGGITGTVAGTAIGTTAGPIGVLLGGLAGAIAGWWSGRAVAEAAEKRDQRSRINASPDRVSGSE